MTADVIVIGAGPAGAVASRTLALEGWRVVLVDAGPGAAGIGESLPGAARPLLRDLGLLPYLERSLPLVCIANRSAWGGASLRTHDFIRDPHGAGWLLDRGRFDQVLRDAAVSAGVQTVRERLEEVCRDGGAWRVRLGAGASGRVSPVSGTLSARWLIDASGRGAVLARRLGVARIRDRRLIAVYAWAEGSGAERRTLIEAIDKGWWYHAQLPGDRCVAALHTRPDEAAALQRCRRSWLQCLEGTRHLRASCHDRQWGVLRACDASGGRLQCWGEKGWLAVGDAAQAFDPLSSQGIFNALYTGVRGAQAVSHALQGRLRPLQDYFATLQGIRDAYLSHADHYYRREHRWPHEPFWQERHGPVP